LHTTDPSTLARRRSCPQIRTPLNIVGVGAGVLRTELKALGERVPGAILELVDGIADASTAALEVNEIPVVALWWMCP